MEPYNSSPIFIFGMSQRTGTNFLYNLLIKHPHCSSSVLYEGFVLQNADLLKQYAEETQVKWKRMGLDDVVNDFNHDLAEYLGSGILNYLNDIQIKNKKNYGKDQRLVIKTPSIKNIELFTDLFPKAKMLILIRDGRAVVESHFRSFSTDPNIKDWFGQDRTFFMNLWANAAEELVEFEQKKQLNRDHYLIVRYEDLYTNMEEELTRIFDFLNLDVEYYNFEYALQNTPVIGSSTFGRKAGESVSWKPLRKTSDFDPLNRAANWSDVENEQFESIAGQYQEYFKYPL